jgi:hypothetical protein
MSRIRTELRDALELFLVPGVSILLPWFLCFRLYRVLSRQPWLYAAQTEHALQAAQRVGVVDDPVGWSADFRLTQIIDHADLYLSRFRSDRWLQRHVCASGDSWPRCGGFVLVGFHWGVGMWVLRHLRSQGLRTAIVSNHIVRKDYPGQVVRYWYGRIRMAEAQRIGRSPLIFTGGGVRRMSVRRMLSVIGDGTSVMALIDLPLGGAGRGLPVRFLGRSARFPSGLTRMAFVKGIPVLTFRVGLDRTTGARLLRINGPLCMSSEQAIMDRIGRDFDEALRTDAAAWHFWALIDQFQ